MNLKYLFGAVAMLCLTAACHHVEKITPEQVSAVRVGMTRAEVKEILGEPLEHECYNKQNIWFYYTHSECRDGLVSRDECMPFVFDADEDRLLGYGYKFYNENSAIPDRKTQIRQ